MPTSRSRPDRPPDRLARVPAIGAALAATVGMLVLLGWITDIEELEGHVGSFPPVKPNTAIALVVCALGLALLRVENAPRAHRLGRRVGLGIALFGLLVCAEYVFGNAGIDQLLVDDAGSRAPGRPATPTAIAFVLLGAALATLDHPRYDRAHEVLVAMALVTTLFSVVGEIYGVDALRGASGTSGIAVPTIVALVALTAGLVCIRPQTGTVALLRGTDPGARLARTLLPIVTLGSLGFGLATHLSEQTGVVGRAVVLASYTIAMVLTLVVVVLLTARRLRSADAQIRRLATVVESSADAVVSMDRDGRFTSWNEGAQDLLGYTSEELIGKPVTTIVPDDLRDEITGFLSATGRGEVVRALETKRRRKDGTLIDVELTVSPLLDETGAWIGSSAILRDVGERHEARRRFASLLEAAPDAMIIVDHEGRIALVNRQAELLTGYSREELDGEPIELLVPDGAIAGHREVRERFSVRPRTRAMGAGTELTIRCKDGTETPVEVSLSPLRTATGLLVIAAVRDVSARRRAERDLAQSEERFRRSFEDSAVGMALVAAGADGLGDVLEANAAFETLSGRSEEELRAQPLLARFHPADAQALEEELRGITQGAAGPVRVEARLVRASGDTIWTAVSASVVRDPAGAPVHVVLQVQDTSERKHFEDQLQYLADHDALTGLFTRRRFEEELHRAVALADRYDSCGAVLVIDLDDFKLVNDTLGHAAGDRLIVIAARILQRRLRESDVIGRMGGDEFAVVLPHVTAEQARDIGQSILQAMREDEGASVVGGTRRVTASIGVAMFGTGQAEVGTADLLAQADIAMYDAKDAGRDRVAVYDAASPRHRRFQARLSWTERIEIALDEDRFVLHAQPIASLEDPDELRYELLLRMRGEDDELIAPGEFLDVAEDTDLAPRIDRWVVTRAVRLLEEQLRAGRDVRFHINLSARSIDDAAMPDHIAAALGERDVDPGRLILEVTETAAIVNLARAATFARRVQEIGCGFALDDFGTGFASFYYLKHLTFDYLKIDGEFIRDLVSDRTDQMVVRSVVEIARGLGKRTIAEYVGDQPTVDLLRSYGVDHAQGYFLGRPGPLPPAELSPNSARGGAAAPRA